MSQPVSSDFCSIFVTIYYCSLLVFLTKAKGLTTTNSLVLTYFILSISIAIWQLCESG